MRTRPPKLQDPAEVERICRKYLDDCAADRANQTHTLKSGALVTYGEWPSYEGLSLALGIDVRTLERYISKAPVDGGEGGYRGCRGVPSSNSQTDSLNSTKETDSTALKTGDIVYTQECVDYVDGGYEDAHFEICRILARVKTEIIQQVTNGADSGQIDSKVAQLRLGRLGIVGKVEGDNTRKIEFVNYTADEVKALMT